MFSALLYLQYHSVKNRLVQRIKRLKQPKYLSGAIVGGLYFYWYFGRGLMGFGRNRQAFQMTTDPDNLALIESGAALLLFVIVFLAWLLPHERAALAFTEAEIAFLFPAPVSRRWLIHFKLLRSQMAILFTTLLLSLLTRRFGASPWIRIGGWWVVLSTLNLHFLGCSFTRTLLLEKGISNWKRRLGILGLVALLLGGVFLWAKYTTPAPTSSDLGDVQSAKAYFDHALNSGPAPFILFPFRVMVRPFLSPNTWAFLLALPAALGVMALHYFWVARSDVAFEEASVEASKKLAEKITAIRSGNWQGSKNKPKAKRPPFQLQPTGLQPVALLWKNLIGAGQMFTLRLIIVLGVTALAMSIGVGKGAANSGVPTLIAMISAMLLIWSLMLGPQIMRQDFRHDLPRADILKMYPMPGWQIAFGELLAPAVILTGFQWLLLILAIGLAPRPHLLHLNSVHPLSLGLSAALILPMLNMITLQIPNASVLLFPAWFQTARDGASQGIEATGQRLIFMLGQLLVFIISMIPASGTFALVFLLVKATFGFGAAIPLAAIAAAIILGIEAALGIVLLGWLFDRFDVAAESAP